MEPLRTLRQCLIDTELPRLRIIERLWGVEVLANRPLEIAAELAQALIDPVRITEMWQTLTADERAALNALLAADGFLPAAVFVRRFGEIRPVGPGRLEREAIWRDPVSPSEGLWYKGLIFEGFVGDSGDSYPVFFVPPEFRAVLPMEGQPEPVGVQLESVDPPTHRCLAGDHLLDDLTTVLSYIHNEVVRPRHKVKSAWPEGSRKALVPLLRDRDAQRLDFMLQLIDHLGWTRWGDEGRLRLVAEPVLSWLQEAAAQAKSLLVDAWLGLTGWNELWQLTTLRPDDTGVWHHDPRLARRALLRHLDAVTPDEWVPIDDFIALIKSLDPDFQRPGGDYETWYLRDSVTGEYMAGFDSWGYVEGALLRVLLQGPAHWLDLVEIGAAAAEGPAQVFRRSSEQDLAKRAELSGPPQIHPNLTIALPAALRKERFQLARIADVVAVGDFYVYRLTPTSLNRARQQRIDLGRILGYLDELGDAPLPDAVRTSLARWVARGTEVRLERIALLRVADQSVMQQILTSKRAGQYIEEVISETVATVTERHWLQLRDALAELGLLADVTGAQGLELG